MRLQHARLIVRSQNMIDNVKKTIQAAECNYARALGRLNKASSHAEFAEFLAIADDVRPFDSYKVFSAGARSLVDRIRANAGEEVCRSFLRGAISLGVVNTLKSDRFRHLPGRVAAQQLRQLGRLANDYSTDCDWLDLDNDLFQKELGLATMRLYAAGAQVLEIHSGVPRSLIFRGGKAACLSKLASMLRLGGFRPYFQIHTHQFMLDAFNEAGWKECYLCCAELYAVHPEVLGMHSASWYFDPALRLVSPHLAHLRETPVQGGARLFLYEEGGTSITNSLAKSATRRKLYQEGKYHPKSYMLVWGKRSHIAWARHYLSRSNSTGS